MQWGEHLCTAPQSCCMIQAFCMASSCSSWERLLSWAGSWSKAGIWGRNSGSESQLKNRRGWAEVWHARFLALHYEICAGDSISLLVLYSGKSNPYCEISMGSQSYTTRTLQDTLNPKWNFNCQFFIKDLYQDVLCITMFDRDQFSPDGKSGPLFWDVRASLSLWMFAGLALGNTYL